MYATYNIFKNYKQILRSTTVFKTKRKNIDRYKTFYFLLYLLWIVQVSRELLSSQWKPQSFLVKTLTLKSSHFGKRLYARNQIRTTFSGPSVSKIFWVGSPGYDIGPFFTQAFKCMGLKSLFFRKIWKYTLQNTHTLFDKQLGAWIFHYLVECTLRSIQTRFCISCIAVPFGKIQTRFCISWPIIQNHLGNPHCTQLFHHSKPQ